MRKHRALLRENRALLRKDWALFRKFMALWRLLTCVRGCVQGKCVGDVQEKIRLFCGKYGALLRKIHERFESVCTGKLSRRQWDSFGQKYRAVLWKVRALLRKMWVSFAGNVGIF